VARGGGHMLSEKSQWTQNGTMFVDLDWPLNASRRLSASAELLVLTRDAMRKWGLRSRSVRLSVSLCATFVYCIYTAENIVKLHSRPVAQSF